MRDFLLEVLSLVLIAAIIILLKSVYPPPNVLMTDDHTADRTAYTAADAALKQQDLTVDINLATVDELVQLKGIGAVTAQKIVDYRQEHGYFTSVQQIVEVKGIGPSKFQAIRHSIVVDQKNLHIYLGY